MIVDGEEFIAVKSFHAKGKRLTNYNVKTVTELEPRIVEEDLQEEGEEPAAEGGEELNDDISQQEVLDKLTGQTRLFEDDNN